MFDHVTLRATDRALRALLRHRPARPGVERTATGEQFAEWADLSIAQATDERPATRHLHVGFAARSRDHVDAFWEAGTAAGYRSDAAPGPRPVYRDDCYGAFLLDPDGNSAEAVHHGALRTGGMVDHVWIRVADLEASRRFCETIGPHAGLHRGAAETAGTGRPPQPLTVSLPSMPAARWPGTEQ